MDGSMNGWRAGRRPSEKEVTKYLKAVNTNIEER